MRTGISLRAFIALFSGLFFLNSCVYVVDTPGPDGQPGEAFFGVDYDYALPYSYWDDNRSIPFNPVLGTYYPTGTGIYNFEYYINPYDYWYGTYQVFRNAGQLGGSGGRPGADGADTYLMLICNPDGFYEVRSNYKVAGALGETIVIEETVGENRFRIEMTRTNTDLRPSVNEPKYLNAAQ
jgi:hypothetical protein